MAQRAKWCEGEIGFPPQFLVHHPVICSLEYFLQEINGNHVVVFGREQILWRWSEDIWWSPQVWRKLTRSAEAYSPSHVWAVCRSLESWQGSSPSPDFQTKSALPFGFHFSGSIFIFQVQHFRNEHKPPHWSVFLGPYFWVKGFKVEQAFKILSITSTLFKRFGVWKEALVCFGKKYGHGSFFVECTLGFLDCKSWISNLSTSSLEQTYLDHWSTKVFWKHHHTHTQFFLWVWDIVTTGKVKFHSN